MQKDNTNLKLCYLFYYQIFGTKYNLKTSYKNTINA